MDLQLISNRINLDKYINYLLLAALYVWDKSILLRSIFVLISIEILY